MSRAEGWYLEWDLNNEFLLIIKSTCQERPKVAKETNKIKIILERDCVKCWKGPNAAAAFAFKQYTVEHPKLEAPKVEKKKED